MRQIIVLLGPTASGKTDLSLKKAEELKAEIISADAFQVYKGLDIGTAKLTDTKNIPHHLIDIKNPDESYNVTEFIENTKRLLKNTPKTNFIITGGTAMYLHALLYDYQFPKETKESTVVKETLEKRLQTEGPNALWNELNQKDPEIASKTPKENTRRVIRALTILEDSKKSTLKESRAHSKTASKEYEVIGINRPREELIQRINQRVDLMFKEGLVDEVETLLKKYPKDSPGFQAIGYKEVIAHLEGEMTLDKTIEIIKIKTRQFAKRQMTWFRRFESTTWIH